MDCFQLLYMLVGVEFITSASANKNHTFSKDLSTQLKLLMWTSDSVVKSEFKYDHFYFSCYFDPHVIVCMN